MNYNNFCSCGQLVLAGAKCSCKKFQRSEASRKHISSSPKFQRLRKEILFRDKYKCQRCLIKFDILTTTELECHHIKPYEKYPELGLEATNLIMVCRRCNLDLGTSGKLDFEWEPKELEFNL